MGKALDLTELEGMRTSDLAGLYIRLFPQNQFWEAEEQIGQLTAIMRKRPLEERRGMYSMLNRVLQISVNNERFEDAAALRDMIQDYRRRVLRDGK